MLHCLDDLYSKGRASRLRQLKWHRGRARQCRCAAHAASPLRDADVPTRTVVIDHEPVRALTDVAIGERACLIVVGIRGDGGFPGHRLGSTALKILHHSGLPVVLVPATP